LRPKSVKKVAVEESMEPKVFTAIIIITTLLWSLYNVTATEEEYMMLVTKHSLLPV